MAIHTEAEALRIIELSFGYIAGQLSEAENAELTSWRQAEPENEFLFAELTDPATRQEIVNKLSSYDIEGALMKIKTPAVSNRYPFFWLKIAAALVVLALGAALLLNQGRIINRNPAMVNVEGILPGTNRATLTLADGRKIALDSMQTTIVVSDESIKYSNNSLVLAGGTSAAPMRQLSDPDGALLALTTPKGGQYQIILSDGSKVWLNAETTLRYPAKFTGDTRTIELEGEAYFAVLNSGKEPSGTATFVVKSKGQTTKVLGTEFNISSYKDNPFIKTTLIKGAVLVSTADHTTLLKPGEQTIVRGDTLLTDNIDTSQEIAWRNGQVSLAGKTLQEILTEFSRWYDIEVLYEGNIPQGAFFGSASRDEGIGVVLKLLESAGARYRLEGKKLIVNPKNR